MTARSSRRFLRERPGGGRVELRRRARNASRSCAEILGEFRILGFARGGVREQRRRRVAIVHEVEDVVLAVAVLSGRVVQPGDLVFVVQTAFLVGLQAVASWLGWCSRTPAIP